MIFVVELIFDDFYSKLYDKLLLDEPKLNFEINYIFQNQAQEQNKLKTYNVLDIGCGTGHHINKITNSNNKLYKILNILDDNIISI